MNQVLAEELEVVNAIYGAGTLIVLTPSSDKLRLRLELPLYEVEKLVFWLNFDADYPNTVPSIQQAELTLLQETDRRVQNIYLILFSLLHAPGTGETSIESAIYRALPITASLQYYTFDPDIAVEIAPYANPGKSVATSHRIAASTPLQLLC